jgi:hydrogenase maturation factor
MPAILFASEADVRSQLVKSLTCQINPLDTVRGIAKKADNKYDSGYIGLIFGEGMQHTAVVNVRSPIVIAGAKANTIVASTIFFYENAAVLVHARFTGDYKRVVTELGLQSKKNDGSFVKPTKVNLYGEPVSACPMTIELQSLENGEFVLGCGWCNG